MEKTNSNVLVDGLIILLNKVSKLKDIEEINDYLLFGSEDDFNIKEEIARLTLIATTLPTSDSPIIGISDKIKSRRVFDIDSMFIKEFLEMRERNKKNAFMKSDFYKKLSLKVEEMELNNVKKNLYLNNGIILCKNLKNLYISNLDKNINDNKLDIIHREPLIDLFQHNLDCTLEKLRNGER